MSSPSSEGLVSFGKTCEMYRKFDPPTYESVRENNFLRETTIYGFTSAQRIGL
jgi:hypothetical protein